MSFCVFYFGPSGHSLRSIPSLGIHTYWLVHFVSPGVVLRHCIIFWDLSFTIVNRNKSVGGAWATPVNLTCLVECVNSSTVVVCTVNTGHLNPCTVKGCNHS